MTISGMPEHILHDIEMRLLGADHRPWAVSVVGDIDHAGRRMIMKGSRNAAKKALRAAYLSACDSGANKNKADPSKVFQTGKLPDKEDEPVVDGRTLRERLTLFFSGESTTVEMLEFVAQAPEDIEMLVNEVKQLRRMLELCQESRDRAVGELQQHKVAASRAEAKIVDMRRAWRDLMKEIE